FEGGAKARRVAELGGGAAGVRDINGRPGADVYACKTAIFLGNLTERRPELGVNIVLPAERRGRDRLEPVSDLLAVAQLLFEAPIRRELDRDLPLQRVARPGVQH